jgi:hypothetical protein
MRRPATIRRAPPAPTDEGFLIRLATEALTSVMTDLRCRVEHTGTRRSVVQVLLAEAHIAEAVSLLRAIQPISSLREFASARPVLSPAPPTRSRVQQPRRPHRPQGLAC